MGFPDSSVGKESACNAGDPGLIPGLGRTPGEGKGYPLHYSGLDHSMDCIVHGVTKSRTRLSDFHFTTVQQGSLFSTSSPAFIVCKIFFYDGHSHWYEVIPHCGFDLHFSNNE